MLESSMIDLGAPLSPGELWTVPGGHGLVIVADADGGDGTSSRSKQLAQRLQWRELSTLVFELLTPDEAERPGMDQHVELLTQRLLQGMAAVPPALQQMPIGLLGTDTGAAAALMAATRRPKQVRAVVAKAGRLDLAAEVLGDVRAATLLIVGAADPDVLDINRQAFARLRCEKRIDIVPRATHLFLEAGAIDEVVQHTGDWFGEHLQEDSE